MLGRDLAIRAAAVRKVQIDSKEWNPFRRAPTRVQTWSQTFGPDLEAVDKPGGAPLSTIEPGKERKAETERTRVKRGQHRGLTCNYRMVNSNIIPSKRRKSDVVL